MDCRTTFVPRSEVVIRLGLGTSGDQAVAFERTPRTVLNGRFQITAPVLELMATVVDGIGLSQQCCYKVRHGVLIQIVATKDVDHAGRVSPSTPVMLF